MNNGFDFSWHIENFDFCWHKTGECLESPSFWINESLETSWRLCLYPRGEDDGEYISCYLFREEGGPEVVDVDFELYLNVGDSIVKHPTSFLKIYSFKSFQREGLKCFAPRREIFAPMAAQKERFTLTLGCRIFNVDEVRFNETKHFARTTIVMERLSGTEAFDDQTDLEPENCKDMEVKPLLENDPLIGINLSCFQESLVIKIHPKSCEKIKYAICKITLIQEWKNGSPIEYVQSWIGKIQAQMWRCHAPYQETESVKLGFEFIPSKTFILHYDFAFSTGDELVCNSLMDHKAYLKMPKFSFPECLNMKLNTSKCIPTALDALKSLWTSGSFSDVVIENQNASFPSHKALLCARSSKIKCCMTTPSAQNIPFSDADLFRKFLLFLYTDDVGDLSWVSAIQLCRIAISFKVEILEKKCKTYLTDVLDVEKAGLLLALAEEFRDSHLKAIAESYILTYDDLVFNTQMWKLLSKNKKLIKETMLLKYTKKKTIR
ncbi:hypothetical protein AVEN_243530-1 [Araneus ventricosus]|uniref:Speckle-type POZ protein n=1 Tax=Araneus ventricosus TaxID=182803 RepID=A0A4Y2NW45_ARAVE|nr:hypothetical protein AVEN_243530-1 [Araneus ventricosus]